MSLVQLLEPKWYFIYILQAFTPSRETILRKDKTERLYSMSGLLVLKCFGILL